MAIFAVIILKLFIIISTYIYKKAGNIRGHQKAPPVYDRKGELALYHLRLHRSIYMHINSNASCPVTWTNRKNLCRLWLSGFFGSKATFHDFYLKHLPACPDVSPSHGPDALSESFRHVLLFLMPLNICLFLSTILKCIG